MKPLPDGPLVAWYGDDFTGASAVMEVLSFAGFPSVLFFDVPTPAQLARFGALRGIGIASDARTRSPEWMDAHLPAAYAALQATGAPITHYKICSTLDSSPTVGSVGRAADLGLTDDAVAPLVIGAPAIGRWQAFGNLFAVFGGKVHRLDRHPTMSVHPVTPMDEGDVTLHVAKQTARGVGLVDLLALKAGRGAAGLAPEVAEPPRATAAGRVAVVSGSCSPVTAEQIATAEAGGFAGIAFDAVAALDPAALQRETARAAAAALAALGEGRDPLVYTARGPRDPEVARFREAGGDAAANQRLGTALGQVLNAVVREARLTRAAIAGGDTSSAAAGGLGIYAVTAAAVLAPGSALMHGHGDDPATDGIEIALKGGQMGAPNYFITLRDGLSA